MTARIHDFVAASSAQRLYEGPSEDRTPFGFHPELLKPGGYTRLIDQFRERTEDDPNIWLFLWQPFGLGPTFDVWPSVKPGGQTPQLFKTAKAVAHSDHAHVLDDFVAAVAPVANRTVVYLGSPFESSEPRECWRFAIMPLVQAGVHRVFFDALWRLEEDNYIGRSLIEMIEWGTPLRVGGEPNAKISESDASLYAARPSCGDWIHGLEAEKRGRVLPTQLQPESVFWVHHGGLREGEREDLMPIELVSGCMKIVNDWGTGAATKWTRLGASHRQALRQKAAELASITQKLVTPAA